MGTISRSIIFCLLSLAMPMGAICHADDPLKKSGVTVDKGTKASPIKVLILGDSLTSGYGIPKDQAYPALVQQALQKKGFTHVNVVNGGISGSTSASGLGRLKWHLKGDPKPSVLILALGANDGLRGLPVKNMQKNLAKVIDLAQEQNLKVLLVGMKMPPNYGPEYTEEFERSFATLASEQQVTLLPFLLEGVAAEEKLNLADGIHPNENGHKAMAKNILKHLIPMLKS